MNIPGFSMLVREILAILFVFILYYAFNGILNRLISNAVYKVVMQRIIGACLLSIPALLFLEEKSLVLHQADLIKTVLFSLIFSSMAVIVSAYRKRTNKDMNAYPHIRESHWSLHVCIANAISWMIYLLPYEFVLRGTLLTHSLSATNLLAAFVINGIVYSLAHAPQGWRETLSSFPFGLLLCTITYITGNFWSAYVIHVFLALSNDYFAIKNNPLMHFTTYSLTIPWRSIKKTSH